ncbi:4-hydroxybenzoate 3-monooxygenase [Actinocorallia lasiicapitis]
MNTRTQVGVIGAGPAGLTLANLLRQAGVECVVLEAHSRVHVEARARAGLIEHRVAVFLAEHGLADGLLRAAVDHGSCEFRFAGQRLTVRYGDLAGGRTHRVYPQQFLVRDLIATHLSAGGTIRFSAPARSVRAAADGPAVIEYGTEETGPQTLTCDFIVGCDGFHGVTRHAVPEGRLRIHGQDYPLGWLALLTRTPPSAPGVVYAMAPGGFAGHMPRTESVTRFYLQCSLGETTADWPDERIWRELRERLAMPDLPEGPILDKSVLEMRSRVVEPLQDGRLFLAGDAAHILTPVGAKGMNLAIEDVRVLAAAFTDHYRHGSDTLLRHYSDLRLPHIWEAQEFSDWMLRMIHRMDHDGPFEERLRHARLRSFDGSGAFPVAFAQAYVGAASPGLDELRALAAALPS